MGLAAFASASASLAASAPRVPVLDWGSCHGGFQCAAARVPLDYRHPDGAKISIAVIRHLATDPAHRLGSLFINGGGPSAQVNGLASSYQAIPAALRAAYDIITFDPRGFGASTPIRCFRTQGAENALLAPITGYWRPARIRSRCGSGPGPPSTRTAPGAPGPCCTTTARPMRPAIWTCCAGRWATRC